MLSVALSVGCRVSSLDRSRDPAMATGIRPGVTRRRSLSSPDFPPPSETAVPNATMMRSAFRFLPIYRTERPTCTGTLSRFRIVHSVLVAFVPLIVPVVFTFLGIVFKVSQRT